MPSARFPSAPAFFVGVVVLLCASPSAFAFKIAYTVGGDGFCDFSDIPAAIAAAADNPPHNIYVAVNATYSAEALAIDNQDVRIVGGFANCHTLVSPSANTTISGALNGGKSVIAITGTSNVTLQNLTITGANKSADFTGGGIDFAGSGTLTLAASQVTNNTAGDGGGINVSGSPGPLTLSIQAYTLINFNTALVSGGGIRVAGNARLFMLEDFTYVAFNTATSGDGGGLQVLGPARADIGSPGYNLAAVINSNMAVNGGGVSLEAGQDYGQDARVRLFSTDATRPVRISSNVASSNGGGIYLNPVINDHANVTAVLCAHDYRIDSNDAAEGSAIYVDAEGGEFSHGAMLLESESSLRGLYGCDPETTASLGAKSCTLGVGCNLIDGNGAKDINNNPTTDAATIFGQPGANLYADRLVLRGNYGGYALRQVSSQVSSLSNCLFAENNLRHELVYVDSVSQVLTIDNCTFANDLIGAAHVIRTNTGLMLTNTIIAEAGTLALDYTGNNLDVEYVLSNDISTLPEILSINVGDPLFVGNGNYHLQAYVQEGVVTASPAIDYAPLVPGDDYDLDGRLRDQDVAAVGDVYGYRDLGAYEMQPIIDRVFADGFGDRVSLVY